MTKRYRPNVGIVLQNSQGQVFIGQRIQPSSEFWQMPQGGIDEGETPAHAVWREMLEEIGTNKATMLAEIPDWLYYDLPPDLAGRLWGGGYVGQKQKWFLFRFTGEDQDINLHTAQPEFAAWRWATPQEVIDLAIDFKQQVYRDVLKFLKLL